MAKLLAAAILLTPHLLPLQEPFLPFLPAIDSLGTAGQRRLVLQTSLYVTALALLLNRFVRLSAFLLGATLLSVVLSSQPAYGTNRLLCALLLMYAGLWEPKLLPWVVRAQVAFVYLAAGVNKALEPDWWSGQFFEHWLGESVQHPAWIWLSPKLPPLMLGKLFGAATIGIETTLGASLLIPRLWPYPLWGSVLFQSAMMLSLGTTFTLFFYVMQASLLAFVRWPHETVIVHDAGSRLWPRIAGLWKHVDFDRGFRFVPLSEPRPAGAFSGLRAFHRLLLGTPAFWFAVFLLIEQPGFGLRPNLRRAAVACLLLFFFPVLEVFWRSLFRRAGRLLAVS